MVAAVAPFVTTASPLDPVADLFAVVALLALGTVALALAGIDTGTAFGGMGASREMTILALVEPTLLVAIFALSVRVGSTNLAAIVTVDAARPGAGALPGEPAGRGRAGVVVVAETGRLPVDNPATHLELTMVHEAMVLEYAGPDLALVELGSAMRLTVLPGPAGQPVRAVGHRRPTGHGAAAVAGVGVGAFVVEGGAARRRAGRRRGVPGQAAAVPGARTARRVVRPRRCSPSPPPSSWHDAPLR